MYYFDPGKLVLKEGDWCIVETARGKECGEVVQGNREVSDGEIVSPLKPVIRIADGIDIKKMQALAEGEHFPFHREALVSGRVVDVEHIAPREPFLFDIVLSLIENMGLKV